MRDYLEYCKSEEEFSAITNDLMKSEKVRELARFSQHLDTSRLDHSINVAYYTYKASKRLGLDYVSATRAALMHDLFLYDWREEKQPEGAHAFAHPVVALRNAKELTDVNHIEQDAILKHMWPVTPIPPKYMESYVVCFADKLSAVMEVAYQMKDKTKRGYYTAKSAIFGTQ